MWIVGLILVVVGSLVPMDARAKNACVVLGIILIVVGVILMFTPYRLW